MFVDAGIFLMHSTHVTSSMEGGRGSAAGERERENVVDTLLGRHWNCIGTALERY